MRASGPTVGACCCGWCQAACAGKSADANCVARSRMLNFFFGASVLLAAEDCAHTGAWRVAIFSFLLPNCYKGASAAVCSAGSSSAMASCSFFLKVLWPGLPGHRFELGPAMSATKVSNVTRPASSDARWQIS